MPDVEAYTVDSTPADCVRFAVLGLQKQFDLVLSGINKGTNLGSDIEYSGTVGAVYEANLWKIPTIAFSTSGKSFASAAAHLDAIWDYVSRHKLMDAHCIYNINIPLEVKGIRITRQGGHYTSDKFISLKNDMYQASGICLYKKSQDYSVDTHAYHHGYVSITPLTTQRTQMQIFEALKGLNADGDRFWEA